MPHMRPHLGRARRRLSHVALSHPRLEPCAAPGAAIDAPRQSDDHGRSTDVPLVSDSPTRSCCAPAARCARPGQGTVEYVALILLVALVMAGVVAAMKGFRTDEGKELGDVILGKIKEAVRKVEF